MEEAVVKKTLVSVILGIALLTASGTAYAEQQQRAAEPRWGIRPNRAPESSALDLARWLACHLLEAIVSPATAPAPSLPPSDPEIPPVPLDPDGVCSPERVHCPVG